MAKFNEDSRVKIPTILHLIRLKYDYISLKNSIWDQETNIFTEIFEKSILNLNKGITDEEVRRLLEEIKLSLENEDLGKAFYEMLLDQSEIKLIDFEDFNRNTFNVVTELTYKNGDEEFRPDITLLINGLPLVFIEVKKPHNKDGVLAEHERIIKRFQNTKFNRFINITQMMLFSNNMEYSTDSSLPIEGAFYASSSYQKPIFNFFREEKEFDLEKLLRPEDERIENEVLKDNNLNVIKHSPEFKTNKSPSSPTNRICTSLLSRDRLSFMLKYAFAFVKETDGLERHVMRYPQVFATMAIANKLDEGIRKGIIWHTQGSGKTALAYYNVRFLIDYFQKKSKIPKFYFIVDRLDLLTQAHREFTSRGLIVHTINSRDEFSKDIKSTGVIHNYSGKPEITVVNIHKFENDPNVITTSDYDVNIQRIYFLDEVHRSYNPKGSFLANLNESDRNAIKIGLTGTPLLGDDYNSKALFGNYIHKYYYNASIADGYTLRLIREEIASNYKITLQQALTEVKVLKGDVNKKFIYAHPHFVEPMLDYIIEDFERSRILLTGKRIDDIKRDETIGGMVICDSADQAKQMYKIFNKKYKIRNHMKINSAKSAALILHDEGTPEERKTKVEDFKAGKIDLLFVYNMLITGFDAKRLKKLYLGRVIKKHNLLQALTRVNRAYKDFRYGYVVDFADIRKEFDATNKAYFEELQDQLGDEIEHYTNLFKSKEEIEQEIEQIKDVLFHFDTGNAEIFSQQISQIQDRKQVQTIKKALEDTKSLFNLIRLFGHYEILEKLDFKKLGQLYREVSNHLNMINLKENLENNIDISNLLNQALEEVYFMFTKVSEEELIIADKLKSTLSKTREALAGNFDHSDPEFIKLREELERVFRKKNLNEVTQDEMNNNIHNLNRIYDKVKELNRRNNLILGKYKNDQKYARIHKRLIENKKISETERRIHQALEGVKLKADDQVLQNSQIMDNESYFERLMMPIVIGEFKNKQKINIDADASRYINSLIVKEYKNELNNGTESW